MQYVSRPHHYIGNRRQENNSLGRIGVSGQISSATSAGDLANGPLGDGIEDPRVDVLGGRCLSDQADVTDVLAGPMALEPGNV